MASPNPWRSPVLNTGSPYTARGKSSGALSARNARPSSSPAASAKKPGGATSSAFAPSQLSRNSGSSGQIKQARAFAAHAELRNLNVPLAQQSDFKAQHLSTLAKECEDKAVEMDDKVQVVGDSLEEKIGVGLIAMGELAKGGKKDGKKKAYAAWDTNNDGRITKPEWRLHIKKIAGCEKANVHDCDDLFAKFDADSGGDISTKEMELAFDKWLAAAAAKEKETEAVRAVSDTYRAAAALLRNAARETVVMEAKENEVSQLMSGEPTLSGRIGRVLSSRNLKTGVILGSGNGGWDEGGDGKINKIEFRRAIRKLGSGLQATTDELLDALFNELDTSKDGELEVEELQKALDKMRAETDEHQATMTQKLVAVKALVAPVKKAQAEALQAFRSLDQSKQGESFAKEKPALQRKVPGR